MCHHNDRPTINIYRWPSDLLFSHIQTMLIIKMIMTDLAVVISATAMVKMLSLCQHRTRASLVLVLDLVLFSHSTFALVPARCCPSSPYVSFPRNDVFVFYSISREQFGLPPTPSFPRRRPLSTKWKPGVPVQICNGPLCRWPRCLALFHTILRLWKKRYAVGGGRLSERDKKRGTRQLKTPQNT